MHNRKFHQRGMGPPYAAAPIPGVGGAPVTILGWGCPRNEKGGAPLAVACTILVGLFGPIYYPYQRNRSPRRSDAACARRPGLLPSLPCRQRFAPEPGILRPGPGHAGWSNGAVAEGVGTPSLLLWLGMEQLRSHNCTDMRDRL